MPALGNFAEQGVEAVGQPGPQPGQDAGQVQPHTRRIVYLSDQGAPSDGQQDRCNFAPTQPFLEKSRAQESHPGRGGVHQDRRHPHPNQGDGIDVDDEKSAHAEQPQRDEKGPILPRQIEPIAPPPAQEEKQYQRSERRPVKDNRETREAVLFQPPVKEAQRRPQRGGGEGQAVTAQPLTPH